MIATMDLRITMDLCIMRVIYGGVLDHLGYNGVEGSLGRSSQTQKSGGSVESLEQLIVAEAGKEWAEVQQQHNLLLGEQNAELQRLLEDVNTRLVALQVDHVVVPGQNLMPMDPQEFGALVGAELDRIDRQLQQAFGHTLHHMMHAPN
jgi:hypothetical protein